jgi:hypothetical protein
MLKTLLACTFLVVMTFPAMSESKGKGKGNAACESLKSQPLCEDKQGCAWIKNPGDKAKCRTLKAEPR